MEKVLCNVHGSVCMLKTGLKEGPSKGKSFYVCVDKRGCDFSHVARISPSHCLHHEDSMVELQALTYSLQQQSHRLFFRCIVGKKAGQRWCGSVPWTAPEKEKRNPLSHTQLQPPARNPFKASGKTDGDSEWRRMQRGGGGEEGRAEGGERHQKKNVESAGAGKDDDDTDEEDEEDEEERKLDTADSYRGRPLPPGMKVKKRAEGGERHQKENVETARAGKEDDDEDDEDDTDEDDEDDEEEERKLDTTDSYRGRPLPPGMKVKKRVSDEEKKNCTEADGVGKLTEKKKEEEREENHVASSSSGPEKKNPASRRPHEATPPRRTEVDHTEEGVSEAPPSSSRDAATRAPGPEPSPTQTHQLDDDDDDDVVLVSVKPAAQKTPPVSGVQKTLTAFAGFQPIKAQPADARGMQRLLAAQLQQKKATLSAVNVAALPDKGERLRKQVKELQDALQTLSLTAAAQPGSPGEAAGPRGVEVINPFNQPGGTILLPGPLEPPPGHGPTHTGTGGFQAQSYYGGRMTDDRLLAVKNATCETIDHLHKSLESCPDAEAEAPDPKGIKVELLAHQRRALAWLLWRENQSPCGGIFADDMGLGKTLTIIALILAKKIKAREEEKKTKKEEKTKEEKTKEEKTKEEKTKEEGWISKADCSLVASAATLIICPASLVHHWKREVERHLKTGRLTVYLYHGPNRERRADVLAGFDVVVTTYSLVSKELPVQKEDPQKPSKAAEEAPSGSAPLLRVSWARLVLDEAHNIKNPKVQTSMAVCRLRAAARWAVTGTPIQNNLLDMYSLLKFLRCSPFDEFKVWKSQVDNGSNRGRERLNILTRTLLLRRTKAQRDAKGNPLVLLPDRTCEVHQLKLSPDEQAVYDVVFAQSRSTLQNYLKRHEGNDVKNGNAAGSNPFDKVAQEFGMSQAAASSSQQPQQASSTVHILSLLLRLRQCCCHLSLLKKTLDTSELQGDGIVLSLEEQLNALSLSSSSSSSSSGPQPSDTVALNGSRFSSRLFEDSSESTKIAAIISELKAIRRDGADQKSVIVSQWTSMLRIVAVHLRGMGLRYGVIDGSVAPKLRMDLVEEFNTNADGPQVMLVSLCAGGVGLNLIGGNHLFLMDMHWNPALEDQACDRIYRVGQNKDVTIHRFVCGGTVEEKISTLQVKKKELAQNVLSGTGSTVSKLSLADLRVIFGV